MIFVIGVVGITTEDGILFLFQVRSFDKDHLQKKDKMIKMIRK